MGRSRRSFIKQATSLTALTTLRTPNIITGAKDANIELCLAYFYGLQERKIALSKQMGITGAVSPSAPWMVDLQDVKPWDYQALSAVKDAFAKRGLQWRVLEGTPPLDKAKLGVAGRDQEIDNFITLMKNMKGTKDNMEFLASMNG